MADPTLLDTYYMILGDNDQVGITVTERDGADLSSATATVSVYDLSGVLLESGGASASGTTTRRFWYLLETGDETPISVSGTYVAVFAVSYSSVVKQFAVPVVVSERARSSSD